jgi:cell division protein FtsW (lipid II flippase)
MMLSALGLLMTLRLRPDLALRQAIWVVIGLLGLIVGAALVSRADWLRRYRYSIAAAGLLLTAATLVFGVDPNGSGARLWFSLAGVSFQPVEVLKLLIVVALAGYLHEHGEVLRFATLRLGPLRLPPLAYIAPLLLMLVATELLLVVQRDLGAGLFVSLIFILMVYLASGRLSLLAIGMAGLLGSAWLAHQLFEHVQRRTFIWLDPWSDASGAGYQIVQGLIALANGGLLGAGLAQGSPELVPAVHTDFVIVAIGEELGLAGTLAVIALYGVLVHRGYRIALRSPAPYGQLLTAGLTTAVALQTLIILGGTLRLLPLTGITLPWISYGGSALVANFVATGMLLGCSHELERERA